MSHFSVLVVGAENEEQCAEKLAPYVEQDDNEEVREKYFEFQDQEPELQKEYETEGNKYIVMPDGRLLLPWDDEFRVAGTFGIGNKSHKVPEGLEQREVPFKETFATFEDFAKGWHSAQRDEQGRIGYYRNPNARWDWWLVGGRWTGFWKAKEGATGIIGRQGVMTEPAKPGWYDIMRKGDIDIESMVREEVERVTVARQQFEEIRAGREIPDHNKLWVECERDRDKFRSLYWDLPVVKEIMQAEQFRWFSCDDFDRYMMPLEQHLAMSRVEGYSTFAILDDDGWQENGKMGWWACVSDEQPRETWLQHYKDKFESYPEDTYLAVVDCHI